jgi:hypothetical protein
VLAKREPTIVADKIELVVELLRLELAFCALAPCSVE